jgi:hypothetical protein
MNADDELLHAEFESIIDDKKINLKSIIKVLIPMIQNGIRAHLTVHTEARSPLCPSRSPLCPSRSPLCPLQACTSALQARL